MKMLKKAASIVLASAMVVSLAACGSSNDKGSSADTDTFKIGGIGPTTGDNAIYGTAVKNGIQLAVDEINAAGGINGKQIEYKFEDDQSDADDSDRNTDWDADHAYAESLKQYRIAQLLCRGSHGREDAELLCPFIQ